MAVLFCDLNGFKAINDTAGHAAGDHILQVTAQRLQATLRDSDTIARVGGDEFVIVIDDHQLPEPGSRQTGDHPAHVSLVAQRVTDAIAQPIHHEGAVHVVTVSIGIAYAQPHRPGEPAVTTDALLPEADTAMYEAKRRTLTPKRLVPQSSTQPGQ